MNKVNLIDICEFQGGSQPPKSEWIEKKTEGYIRMLQIRDYTQGHEKYIQYVKDASRLKKCKSNDILIARYGASIGKILTGLEGAYNVALMKTSPNKLLNREYLYHYLKSSIFQNFIQSNGSRAAQAGFNKEDLSTIKINLPILDQQKQIAKTLDKANELINLRKESITKLDELSKSIFIDMFGDPLSNHINWEKKKFVDVCSKVTDGTHHSPPMSMSGYKYITAKHIKENRLNFEKDETYISEEEHRKIFSRCNPVKGDVLYIKDGATTGIACINPLDEEFSLLSSVALIKPSNKIKSEYIVSYLNNPSVKNNILLNMAGGAIKRLTIKKIKDINIIIPPIELQNKFATIIEKIEQQKTLYTQELEKLQENFDALLQKSFQE